MPAYAEAVVETRQTEFQSIYGTLQLARQHYTELVNRLVEVGHRIKNTNYPPPEKLGKEIAARPEGFITNMETETELIRLNNARMEELVLKLEAII